MTGSIAHEFNNPIYGIKNVLEQTYETNAALDKEQKDFLKLAIKECRRMAGLIRQLQFFYRPTSGLYSLLDINRLIEDVASLTQKKMKERQIVFEKRLAGDLPRIKAIEDQIKQVVLNLLQNAEEAIGEKGQGTIVVSTEAAESSVIIRVEDTGSGIPPERLELIFDPFFTTKSAVKGAGLGLSVSYGIVKNHGGDIRAQSVPGAGSVFIVTLPAA